MELFEIISAEDFRVAEIYQSYTNSFPEDERRSEVQFFNLFKNPKVKIYSIIDEEVSVGYMIVWELSDFTFLEHFEVFPDNRGNQIGSRVLASLLKKYPKIVLESEPPTLSEIAERRIGFYGRNGFLVIDETYIQPAYDADKQSLSLWLMANYSSEKVNWIRDEIYDVVYGR